MTLAERFVASVGGIALVLFAGNGLLRFVPALRARPRPVRLAYAWLLGAGAVPGILFSLSHFLHLPLSRGSVLVVFLLLSASVLIPAPAVVRPVRRPPQPRSTQVAVIAAAAIGACVTAGLFAESASEGVRDWDGQMSWTAAGRWISADRSVDSPVLREERWYVSHPRYPPLLPLLQVSVQEAFGTTEDSRVIRPLYAAFFPAFLIVLFDAASRRAGRRPAAFAAGAAALSKNEGWPLALVALAVAMLAALIRSRRERRPAWTGLLPDIIAAGCRA